MPMHGRLNISTYQSTRKCSVETAPPEFLDTRCEPYPLVMRRTSAQSHAARFGPRCLPQRPSQFHIIKRWCEGAGVLLCLHVQPPSCEVDSLSPSDLQKPNSHPCRELPNVARSGTLQQCCTGKKHLASCQHVGAALASIFSPVYMLASPFVKQVTTFLSCPLPWFPQS